MSRKTRINKRELAATLRESVFAPNKPGPLKIMVDVGDPRYYIQRAMEFGTLTLQSPTIDQQIDYLEQAIALLAVAKHTIRSDKLSSVKLPVPSSFKKLVRYGVNPDSFHTQEEIDAMVDKR